MNELKRIQRAMLISVVCGTILGSFTGRILYDLVLYKTPSEPVILNPTPEQTAEYMRTHNGSPPPASWYPKGDPWRGITAKEAEEYLQYCEDTPERNKK